MKKIILALLILFGLQAKATHVAGGSITYKYLGTNKYAIEMVLYRDCYNGFTPFDDFASIAVFRSVDNYIVLTKEVQLLQVQPVSIEESNFHCFIGQVCTEKGIYRDTIQLSPIEGGYTILYQRCCRSDLYLNIVSPGETGISVWTHIPTNLNNHYQNNSPVITLDKSLYFSPNIPFEFNINVIDADGDSLVYGFCTPFAGASSSDPQPNPPDGVVLSIIWPEDFYPNNALGPSNYLNMGANGHCTGMSSNLGRYAIAICAMDFRNGIQLTSTILEVPLTIIDCTTDIDEIDNTTHVNYVNNTLFVTCNKSIKNYVVKVYNISGQELFAGNYTNTGTQQSIPLSLTQIPKGMYSIMVVGNTGQRLFTQKVVN